MHPRAHEQYIYIERELAGRGPRRIFQAPDMVYNRLIQLKQHQTGGKKTKQQQQNVLDKNYETLFTPVMGWRKGSCGHGSTQPPPLGSNRQFNNPRPGDKATETRASLYCY